MVLPFFYIRCNIESKSHCTVFADAHRITIDIDYASLTYAFKLDKDLLAFHVGQGKHLPVPHYIGRQLFDGNSVCIVFVPCTR